MPLLSVAGSAIMCGPFPKEKNYAIDTFILHWRTDSDHPDNFPFHASFLADLTNRRAISAWRIRLWIESRWECPARHSPIVRENPGKRSSLSRYRRSERKNDPGPNAPERRSVRSQLHLDDPG